jgi:predicted Zn-dependent peptidase
MELMPVSQAYFSLGVQIFPYAHPDRYAFHILNNVLGRGMSSRLFHRMREEQGRVFSIGSEYHAYLDDGLLIIEGSTAPEYLLQLLKLTLDELWKLASAEEPVGEEELWKARMQIRGQHLISSEHTNTRMSRLVTQELYFGRYIPGQEIVGHIEAIDTQALKRLSNDVLKGALGRMTIAVVGPDMPEHYNVSSIEDTAMPIH